MNEETVKNILHRASKIETWRAESLKLAEPEKSTRQPKKSSPLKQAEAYKQEAV